MSWDDPDSWLAAAQLVQWRQIGSYIGKHWLGERQAKATGFLSLTLDIEEWSVFGAVIAVCKAKDGCYLLSSGSSPMSQGHAVVAAFPMPIMVDPALGQWAAASQSYHISRLLDLVWLECGVMSM